MKLEAIFKPINENEYHVEIKDSDGDSMNHGFIYMNEYVLDQLQTIVNEVMTGLVLVESVNDMDPDSISLNLKITQQRSLKIVEAA